MSSYKRELRQKRELLKKEFNRHHRIPRCLRGSDDPINVVVVPKIQHQYFHALFGVMTPQEIANLINVYIPQDVMLVVTQKPQ